MNCKKCETMKKDLEQVELCLRMVVEKIAKANRQITTMYHKLEKPEKL